VAQTETDGLEVLETREWVDSLDYVLEKGGPNRAGRLLQQLALHARREGGINLPFTATTPYQNTISSRQQAPFPGSQEMERRIKSLVRWNALAMVVRANKVQEGIGGHISTFASAATLYEVAFNHFFRAKTESGDRDIVYFQGHAAPGIYSRAYLEGRLSKEKLQNFRRELKAGGGLSSYPHPWLMPEFWEFPTVSMGLGPIQAIYHARFIKYLENRGLKTTTGGKVWAFLGDGEMDEPESLGSITLASREKLDNLIFVVNCNLQRLDGPVRGNGKIIQELEAIFRGAGWNVIKCIWGSDWDVLFQNDRDGLLVKRMGEVTDGQYQKYFVESGAYFRQNLFGSDPRLLKMVEHLSDDQLSRMRLGGHDPIKVHAAYRSAMDHKGAPTVILAKTIKGYGLGEAGEGKNITHQQKKLNEEELRIFRSRFGIPIPDEGLHEAPFYRPPDDSPTVESGRYRFTAPLGPIEAEEIKWYLERYINWPAGLFQERAQRVVEGLPGWGRLLFDGVNDPEGRQALAAWRAAATGERRFTVKVDQRLISGTPDERRKEAAEAATVLLGLPWELIHDDGGYLFQHEPPRNSPNGGMRSILPPMQLSNG